MVALTRVTPTEATALEVEQAQEQVLRDLLAPLLAEFANHRPEDDTALIVEAELGHDGRHRHRVRDVGLARTPELALVGGGGGPAGGHDDGGVVVGAVAGELGQERGQKVAQDRSVPVLRLEVSSVRLGVCVGAG